MAEIARDRRVVGFGHLIADTLTEADSNETADGKAMQIRGLFADPDCGVKGVGTALVKELENRAKEYGAVRVKSFCSDKIILLCGD